MRSFIYKTLFIFFCILVVYKFTVGSLISTFENKLVNITSKQSADFYKDKIRNEIKNAIKKDKILNKEDSILINKFINRIKNEIN